MQTVTIEVLRGFHYRDGRGDAAVAHVGEVLEVPSGLGSRVVQANKARRVDVPMESIETAEAAPAETPEGSA